LLRWRFITSAEAPAAQILRLRTSVCVWASSHSCTISSSHAERETKSSVEDVAMASFLLSRTFRRSPRGVGVSLASAMMRGKSGAMLGEDGALSAPLVPLDKLCCMHSSTLSFEDRRLILGLLRTDLFIAGLLRTFMRVPRGGG
jgi:hypothetical protein